VNTTRSALLLALAFVGMGLPAFTGYIVKQRGHRAPLLSATSKQPAAMAVVPEAESQTPTQHQREGASRSIRADLFSAPLPPPAPSPLPQKAQPTPLPVPAAPPIDPLADYVYSGVVMVDGEMSALIENRKTKEGWYVKAGDTWQNYRILSITDDQITVEVNGETHTLVKSDVYNVVPLQANAGNGQAAPGPASPAISAANALLSYTTSVSPVVLSDMTRGDAVVNWGRVLVNTASEGSMPMTFSLQTTNQ